MPEFILNTAGAKPEQFARLDSFTQGFIEAAFFSDSSCFDSTEFFTAAAQRRIHEGQADGSIPNDAGAGDIDAESLSAIIRLCSGFQRSAAALLGEAYGRDYDDTQAGRDLYFTMAGHGVGFWSRPELSADDSDEYERLTGLMAAADTHGPAWNAALAEREKLTAASIGSRLSAAAGRREISLDAYESDESPSGFFVTFNL